MIDNDKKIRQKPLLFTTSWDDGHCMDFHVARLLDRYGLTGTFYVNQHPAGRDFLSECHIQDLAGRFEIGAHTLTHPDLLRLSGAALKEEIGGSKKYLEYVIRKEVAMFCYPKGVYSEQIKQEVRDAGFVGARTVDDHCFVIPEDPFAMATSLQVYPWPFRKTDAKHYFWGRHLFDPLRKGFWKLVVTVPPVQAFFSWQVRARHLFHYALKHGNYFHLWGHSWEIEKYNMWDDLEEFFHYVRAHYGNDIVAVTNSSVFKGTKSDEIGQ